MAFTSLAYAAFLPLALLAYFAVPARGRWAVLLAFSYGFYMSWHPQLILLLWLDTIAAWAGGLALGRARTRAGRGAALALGALPCLGALFFFKYFAFAAETLAALLRPFGVSVPQPAFSLVLPLGISFYTFQALGYLFDVWRAKAPPERHLGYFALFLGFFPQLVSGPIGRAGALLPQLRAPHRPDPARFTAGLQRICTGLFKKVVIADFLAVYVDNVFDALTNQGGLTLILAAVLFSLQLYCDFAGYSDIAIGSARLFGITLAENFQSPYMARSVKEFWRRWHISLSRWFSDYVYIPLGGSRCRRGRHLCNLLVTFLCSGLWHGASWTFVLWGLYHGLWLCAETFYLPRLDAWQARLPRPAARALTVARTLGTGAVVCFGWVLFRVNSLADFGYILQNLGRGLNPLRLPAYAAAAGMAPWALALAAGLAALLLWADWRAVYRRDPLQALNTARRPLRLTVYYLLSLAVLAAACARPFGAQADFIYFQF